MLLMLGAISVGGPAYAADRVVVLRWPGSPLTLDDARLAKFISKAIDSKDLDLHPGDVLFPAADARDERVNLLREVIASPGCDPVVSTPRLQALATYGETFAAFWLVIPVEGDPKDLVVWHWTPEAGTLVRQQPSCTDSE